MANTNFNFVHARCVCKCLRAVFLYGARSGSHKVLLSRRRIRVLTTLEKTSRQWSEASPCSHSYSTIRAYRCRCLANPCYVSIFVGGHCNTSTTAVRMPAWTSRRKWNTHHQDGPQRHHPLIPEVAVRTKVRGLST